MLIGSEVLWTAVLVVAIVAIVYVITWRRRQKTS